MKLDVPGKVVDFQGVPEGGLFRFAAEGKAHLGIRIFQPARGAAFKWDGCAIISSHFSSDRAFSTVEVTDKHLRTNPVVLLADAKLSPSLDADAYIFEQSSLQRAGRLLLVDGNIFLVARDGDQFLHVNMLSGEIATPKGRMVAIKSWAIVAMVQGEAIELYRYSEKKDSSDARLRDPLPKMPKR